MYFHSSTLFYDYNSNWIVSVLGGSVARWRPPSSSSSSTFPCIHLNSNDGEHFQFIIIIFVWIWMMNLTFRSHPERARPTIRPRIFAVANGDFRSCSWKWKANKCDVGFWRTISLFNLQTTKFRWRVKQGRDERVKDRCSGKRYEQ